MEKQIQKISSKGSPRFGEAGGPATGWKTKISKGSILAVSLIILGLMLVSALSFSLVTIQERKASIGENKSNQALQTASTGVEIVLQSIKNHSGGNLVDIDSDCDGTISSADGYAVQLQADDGSIITGCSSLISAVKKVKSIGTAGQNQRAVEVAVAGSGDYTISCVGPGGLVAMCFRIDTSTGVVECKQLSAMNGVAQWFSCDSSPQLQPNSGDLTHPW